MSYPFKPKELSYLIISISRTSLSQNLGVLGGIFHLYSIFKKIFCKQIVENLIKRRVFAVSDLVLTLFADVPQKDTRLIWVKDHCLHMSNSTRIKLSALVHHFLNRIKYVLLRGAHYSKLCL